jgi:hypothetical protein
MFGLVASSQERARHELHERCLNPKEAVIITPRSLNRVRGCMLAFCVWTDGWDFGLSPTEACRVVDTIAPALIG